MNVVFVKNKLVLNDGIGAQGLGRIKRVDVGIAPEDVFARLYEFVVEVVGGELVLLNHQLIHRNLILAVLLPKYLDEHVNEIVIAFFFVGGQAVGCEGEPVNAVTRLGLVVPELNGADVAGVDFADYAGRGGAELAQILIIRQLEPHNLDALLVRDVQLVIVEGEVPEGVVAASEVLYVGDGEGAQIYQLKVVVVVVGPSGFVDHNVETDGPLRDRCLELLLEYFLAFGVPYLEENIRPLMQFLVLVLYLDGYELHGFVVGARARLLVDLVELVEVDGVGALAEEEVGSLEVEAALASTTPLPASSPLPSATSSTPPVSAHLHNIRSLHPVLRLQETLIEASHLLALLLLPGLLIFWFFLILFFGFHGKFIFIGGYFY